MKKKLLLVTEFLTAGYSYCQVLDKVWMNAGYSGGNCFTLDNDNVVSVIRKDWDLAFASDGLGGGTSTIRINGGVGTELYKYNSLCKYF
mgnify:CR=1 FL=1